MKHKLTLSHFLHTIANFAINFALTFGEGAIQDFLAKETGKARPEFITDLSDTNTAHQEQKDKSCRNQSIAASLQGPEKIAGGAHG